jgi:chorismate dehydratase
MNKLRITAVSYLNTLPFVYGLKHALDNELFELSLDVPSACARKMQEGLADIGLVPVGVLASMGGNFSLMDHCIAADGEVSSVLLVSDVPLNDIERIHLDSDSRTSVLLARILALHYWKIQPQWIHHDAGAGSAHPASMVVIGDKAFTYKKRYKYCWDLASEWKSFTSLPFVFAAWMCADNIDAGLLKKVSSALEYGIVHMDEAIAERLRQSLVDIDLKHYLTKCIHFRLDDNYRKGMATFMDLAMKFREI